MYCITEFSLGLCVILIGVSASCARFSRDDRAATHGLAKADVSTPCVTGDHERDGPTTVMCASDTVSPDAKSDDIEKNHRSVPVDLLLEIDLNSGDVRGWRYHADGTAHCGVYESALSKEARRLGISIPEQRDWFRVSGGPRTFFESEIKQAAMGLLRGGSELVRQLDEVQARDEERRDVLERFMTSMRTEPPPVAIGRGRMLIAEIRKRHSVKQ